MRCEHHELAAEPWQLGGERLHGDDDTVLAGMKCIGEETDSHGSIPGVDVRVSRGPIVSTAAPAGEMAGSRPLGQVITALEA